MEAIIYSIALVTIAVTCMLGVLSYKFNDNLFQTVGLGIACLGASVRLLEVFGSFTNETNARYLFTYGIAVFCIGAVWKIWRKP